MIPKDYYKIMDVKPSASAGEIKRSYRRLVMKYHPDKNPGDTIAEATFKAIAEAYNILSDPKKREDYHFKKFNTFTYTNNEPPAVTRQSLLRDINKLQQIVASSDPYRTNLDALYFQLSQILTDDAMALLLKENDAAFTRQVIEQLLRCCAPLTYTYTQKISGLLFSIAGQDEKARQIITAFLQHAYRNNQWNKYKAVVAIVAAIVLCLLIFWLSK